MMYKVSVIVPVYNAERFIRDTLDSIINQTYRSVEILIVDDGSTDSTYDICMEDAGTDNQVRVLIHENHLNKGVSISRQMAINQAGGELIAFCDADDIMEKDKLKKQVDIFGQHPDVILVHTAIKAFGSSADNCRNFEKSNFLSANPHKYLLPDTPYYLWQNKICNSTVMVKSGILNKVDFSHEQAFQYEDWLLWVLLAQMGPFYYLPEQLTRYRDHESTSTARIRKKRLLVYYSRLEFYLALFKKFPKSKLKLRLKILYKIMQTIKYIYKKY